MAAPADRPPFELRFWRGQTTSCCVVIPVVNEGDRLLTLLGRMNALRIPSEADVIVVDRGSDDGSTEVSRLRHERVRGLLVHTGPGRLGAQLRIGYGFAMAHGYEGVVTIDGNDKDDPAGILKILDALRDGADLVQASRFVPGGESENTPPIRYVAIRGVHAPFLRWRSGFPWTDTTQGFRGYSRRLLLHPEVAPFRAVFQGYELLPYLSYRAPRLGLRCVEVPSRRVYPRGAVPTKIRSLGGHLDVLVGLLRAGFGGYDP